MAEVDSKNLKANRLWLAGGLSPRFTMDFPDLLDVPLELPVVCAHGLVPGRKFWLCKICDSQSQYTRVEVYCVVRFLVVHMYIKVQEVPGAGYLEEGCGKVPTGWGYPDTSCAIGRAVVKSSFLTAFQNGVEAFLPALHISGHKGLISHYLPKGFHK